MLNSNQGVSISRFKQPDLKPLPVKKDSGLSRLMESKGLVCRKQSAEFFQVKPKSLKLIKQEQGTWLPLKQTDEPENNQKPVDLWISIGEGRRRYQVEGQRLTPQADTQSRLLIFSVDEGDELLGLDVIL